MARYKVNKAIPQMIEKIRIEKLWPGISANSQSCSTTPFRFSILLKNRGNTYIMATIKIEPLINTARLKGDSNIAFQFSFDDNVVVCANVFI